MRFFWFWGFQHLFFVLGFQHLSFVLGFWFFTGRLLVLRVLGIADGLVLITGLEVADKRALIALVVHLPERLRLRVTEVVLLKDRDAIHGLVLHGRGRLSRLLRRGGGRLSRGRLRRGRRCRLLRLKVRRRQLLRRGRGSRRSRRRRRRLGDRRRCGRGVGGRRRTVARDELGDKGVELALVLVDDVLRGHQVLDAGGLVLGEALGVRDLDLGDEGGAGREGQGNLALGSVRILLLLRLGIGDGLHGLD